MWVLGRTDWLQLQTAEQGGKESPRVGRLYREEVFPKDQGEAMGFRVMPDRHRPAEVAFRV